MLTAQYETLGRRTIYYLIRLVIGDSVAPSGSAGRIPPAAQAHLGPPVSASRYVRSVMIDLLAKNSREQQVGLTNQATRSV